MHLNKRLSLKHAAYIMCGGWSFALLMATMPLLGISDYRKFAVCLPFETQDGLSLGFVIFLMLINGVAFSILMGCYLKMYCAIRGSQVINPQCGNYLIFYVKSVLPVWWTSTFKKWKIHKNQNSEALDVQNHRFWDSRSVNFDFTWNQSTRKIVKFPHYDFNLGTLLNTKGTFTIWNP